MLTGCLAAAELIPALGYMMLVLVLRWSRSINPMPGLGKFTTTTFSLTTANIHQLLLSHYFTNFLQYHWNSALIPNLGVFTHSLTATYTLAAENMPSAFQLKTSGSSAPPFIIDSPVHFKITPEKNSFVFRTTEHTHTVTVFLYFEKPVGLFKIQHKPPHHAAINRILISFGYN